MNILFKALNDTTRRSILEMLKEKDSHHLDLLKQANLVVSVKDGQFILYSINTTVMDEMLKWMMQFSTKTKKK